MAIKYKIVPRKNPQDFEAAPRYYARVVPTGKKTFRELSERVASHTTMSVPDTYGVLMALEEEIIVSLKEGTQIELGNICFLYPSLECESAESEEAFTAVSNITKRGIRIRARQGLVRQMAVVPVEKVS